MTYAEFKEKFLPQLNDIRSFAGKIRLADQYLTRIGSGSGRVVYDVDGEKALKLAKNRKGIAQNEAEAGAGYYRDTQHIVAEIFDSADDDSWLIAEKAKKVGEKRIKELTDIPSLNDLFYFLRNQVDQNNGRGKVYSQSEEMEEFFWENEFSADLINFVVNYGQTVGDMGRPSTYGEVMRDGQPTIVLTDYGLNDEVYDTHYSPQRKQRYAMYELFQYADGNDDILSDAGNAKDIKYGMWAQMPYSVSDGDGVINEEFINFVNRRNTYPDAPISNLPVLTDRFHECVNNIKNIMEAVDDKKRFYGNLLELQNYLIRRGFYNRDPLISEEYQINEDVPDVQPFSLDNRGYADKLAKAVADKLELGTPKFMGGGGNGFAYVINNDVVMKLTSDISEADAASKTMRGNLKYIADIHNLYKVIDTDTNQAFFVIMQENIKDKPIHQIRRNIEVINRIEPQGMGYEDVMTTIRKPKRFDYDEMLEFAKHILTHNPEATVNENDRKAAYQFFVGMMNIRKELLEYDIKSTDYITIENLGYKNGVLTFFDVGGYFGVNEPNIDDENIISLPENEVIDEKYDRETADKIAKSVGEKLGLNPQYLGGGEFGAAYDIGDDKVLKITRDKSEAQDNISLIGKPLKYIAQPYKVFEIQTNNDLDHPTYAIVLEKLKTDEEYFNRMYNRLDYVFEKIFGIRFKDAAEAIHDNEELPNNVKREDVDNYFKKNPKDEEFFYSLLRIWEELEKYGSQSLDFFNPDNLGFKPSGLIGFFDVGFGDGFAEPDAEKMRLDVNEDGTSIYSTDDEIGTDGFPPYNNSNIPPTINNNLDANVSSQMYEDLEYNHVDDATKDEYVLTEEQLEDFIFNDDLVIDVYKNPKSMKRMMNSIRGILDKEGNLYVINDNYHVIHNVFAEWLNLNGYPVAKNTYYNLDSTVPLQRFGDSDNFYLSESIRPYRIEENLENIVIILRRAKQKNPQYNYIIKCIDDADPSNDKPLVEDRKKSWVKGSKAVTVKQRCRLGGKSDGTSDACNQGDINNLEFSSLNEVVAKTQEEVDSFISDSKVKETVYHGSPVGGIEDFNLNKGKEIVTSSGLRESGMYFTSNPNLAEKYRSGRKINPEFEKEIERNIAILHNKQMSVRNNRDYDEIENEIERLRKKLIGQVYGVKLKIKNPLIFDGKGKSNSLSGSGWDELKIDLGYKTAYGKEAVNLIATKNQVAKDYWKYDSIIAKNIIELDSYTNKPDDNNGEYIGNAYVVFSPNQILILEPELMSDETPVNNLEPSNLDEDVSLDSDFVDGWHRYDILHDGEVAGEMEVSTRDKYMILNKIMINPEHRGMGHANDAMKILTDYADKNNKILALTPDTVWGANKNKLINWYKSWGFVMNKGRNIDYQVRELMTRKPKMTEQTEYQKYSEKSGANDNRINNMHSKLDKLRADNDLKYLKPYLSSDEMQLVYNDALTSHKYYNTGKNPYAGAHKLKTAAWEKLEKDNPQAYKEYVEKSDKLYNMFRAVQNFSKKKRFGLDKEFQSDEKYGMGGDADTNEVSHFTTTQNAISILRDGYFMEGDEGGVAFTTNKDLVKQRKPVFYHPQGDWYEGTTHRNLSTQFVLDFNKMKQDGIRYKRGDENIGTHGGEEEIRVYPKEYELPLHSYLKKVIFDPSKEKREELSRELIDVLKEKNIRYYVKNNEEQTMGKGLDEYYSSLVPRVDEGDIMLLQDLPFKEEIENLGGKIYSVGGAVRDEFLGKDSKDLDVLITGVPMDELEKLLTKYGDVNAVGKSFGVIKFIPKGATEEIDIAIPRTEVPTGAGGHQGFDVKSDHELPIEADLKRRDFTINAIAKDSEGNIIDPFDGQEDLKNKIIRVVNPEAFSDDPLRMLRAVQFASRFGFTIEPKTMEMITNNAAKIKEIAPERILIELDKIVTKGEPLIGVQLLSDTGLFFQIFGNQIKPSQIGRRDFTAVRTMAEFLILMMNGVVQNPAEFYLSRFATQDAKRDKVYKELQALELGLDAVLHEEMTPIKARSVAHNMYKTAPQTLQSEILPEAIKNAAQELLLGKYPKTVNELAVNGNDLMNGGLRGNQIGETQKSMLIQIYADKIRNTREDLLNLLNQRKDDVKEGYGYGYYNDSESLKWNVNGEEKDINFFVKEYDKWNGGYYTNPSRESVKQFLGAKFRELVDNDKLNKNLYWQLIDREILNESVKKTEKVEYGALMLYLDIKNWNKITSVIEKDDIYKVRDEFGIETEPHVTILYGFYVKVDAEDVFDLYREHYDLKPIEFEVKGISIFENPDFDVVKLDVESKVLGEMNKLMRELPCKITYPEYHPHVTVAYVKKGCGKKYVKKFEKNRTMKGNKLIFSTKKEKKNSLSLKDTGVLNENQENMVLYSAVVLDNKSRTALIKVFSPMIPKDWEVIAHHQTINMGTIDDQFKELLGEKIELNVTGYAMDDKVMAAAVQGGPSTNKIPHVTIAVNRAGGGKPVMSNNLTSWKPLGFPLKLTGKITEV